MLQGVKNELAVNAYETHARVALESNDLPEFRQCLARLKQLYRAGVSQHRVTFSLQPRYLRFCGLPSETVELNLTPLSNIGQK